MGSTINISRENSLYGAGLETWMSFFFFYTRCYNIQNHGQDQYHDRFCSSNSGKETELHMGISSPLFYILTQNQRLTG